MSKNKTKQDLLLRQADERAPHYSIFTRVLKQLMLPVALISDLVCYITVSHNTFNEGLASYLPIALVGTAALDIPMSMAGELACRQLPQKASRRRWIQVAGLVAVFLVSYIAYLLLLTAQLQELDTSNPLPLYGRCLLPAITSAACFFTSYEAHPAGQRAALLEHQMLELQNEINQVSAEVQRGQAVLSLFDANAFDELQMQNALRQAELGELEERNKLRGMLLEALPTQDGVKAFLLDKLLAADVTDQANEIRQGAHPMPTPQPADAHDTPDQHESVAFPA